MNATRSHALAWMRTRVLVPIQAIVLPAIGKLLTVDNPRWQKQGDRGWTGENQARFNALCALLNSDIPVHEIEYLLVASLGDASGYVPALALEALTRQRNGEDRPGPRRA